MNRLNPVVSKAVSTLALAVICTANAHAQSTTEQDAGVLTPPPEITSIISIDAHNTVLIESQNPDAPNEPKQYSLSVPRHIYSGSIARIFGGTIIPTEVLVIPESARRANFGAPGGVSGIGNGGNFNNGNNNSGGYNNGFNTGNNNTGSFNPINRGFPTYSPRVPVNNINQLNRVLGMLDRPIRQAQIGISQ